MSFCTRQFITRATTHSTNTFAPEEHCLAALVIVPEAPRIAQAPSVPIQHPRNITMPVCQQSKSRCERASLSINHAAMTAACTHTQRERERERERSRRNGRSVCIQAACKHAHKQHQNITCRRHATPTHAPCAATACRAAAEDSAAASSSSLPLRINRWKNAHSSARTLLNGRSLEREWGGAEQRQ